MPESNLSGLWQGQFTYPRGLAPEFFTATLLDAPDFLSGSIQETPKNGRHKGRTFYATVLGKRDGTQVIFVKTYEGPERHHEVHYNGTVSADGLEISGDWHIPGSWAGKFLMIRQNGLVQKATKKVAEKV